MTGRQEINRRRLIDRIVSSPKDGPLRAFVATTYEFQPEFFEVDYLPSLLNLGAWEDRSFTSRIAIEKNLAMLDSACVFLDASCYRGRPRSLRVDVRPVVVGRGARLHAKVTLLLHEDAIRLVVASANLTEPGYRKNREVAAVLRASAEDPAQATLVEGAIRGLPSFVGTGDLPPSVRRALELASERLESWRRAVPKIPEHDGSWFAWSGPGAPLWRQVVERWPEGELITRISIASPFWSHDEGAGPLSLLTHELSARGTITPDTEVALLAEARPSGRDGYRPLLPPALAALDGRGLGMRVTARAVDPSVSPEEVENLEEFIGPRPLHAKVVLIEGERFSLAYLGSANFTRHGWGVLSASVPANVEAGLILLRTGKGRQVLRSLVPAGAGETLLLDGRAVASVAVQGEEPAPQPWPSFLTEALLTPSVGAGDQLDLVLHVEPDAVEGPWSVSPRNAGSSAPPLASGQVGDPAETRVSIDPALLTRILVDREVLVSWWGADAPQAYPINVSPDARERLPVAQGVADPSEALLLSYYQGKISWEELYADPEGPPHAREPIDALPSDLQKVDTTRIQTYQIRDFVEALRGVHEELKAATTSPGAMRLALLGPVSPVSVARAVISAVRQGRRTVVAAGFQLVELLACLGQARDLPVEKHKEEWVALLARTTGEVSRLLEELERTHPGELAGNAAFARYRAALEGFVTKGPNS